MRTTVDLDQHLLKRLRAMALRRGVSCKEMLTAVVRRGLEERPARARRPYRGQTYSMGAPARPLDKALAIAGFLEDDEIGRKLALRK